MKRREFLKGLAAVPVAGFLGGCHHRPPVSGVSADLHTLQIGLEGAFAVVIMKNNGNRVKAFVPRSSDPDLQHLVYFNDAKPLEREKSFHFELTSEGVKATKEPYINPGFNDFFASTEKWSVGDTVISLDLPAPDSINFSMRPQPVIFESGATGVMPTSHIFEYHLTDAQKVKMGCSQVDSSLCRSLPNCPPGVARYFFGVAPPNHQPFNGDAFDDTHAVKFFNFMLETRFPDLVAKYKLRHIGPQYAQSGGTGGASLSPAVMRYGQGAPKLRLASGTIECQLGGILVGTHSAAGG